MKLKLKHMNYVIVLDKKKGYIKLYENDFLYGESFLSSKELETLITLIESEYPVKVNYNVISRVKRKLGPAAVGIKNVVRKGYICVCEQI